MLSRPAHQSFFFFFNDTATTEIYTLSLHDALPIYGPSPAMSRRKSGRVGTKRATACSRVPMSFSGADRKSTRLNSSHLVISYAVFCLKKKKQRVNGYHKADILGCHVKVVV